MAKVFSWKVAPEKYSYLVKDDSTNSYIRNKITDSNILHTMANIVNGWSEGEYSSNYNSMKAEVKSVYGEGVLPEDYREYWNISNITEGTVVLLSGKGGYGDTVPEGGDYFLDETDYKALIDKIEKEFEAQRNALEAKIEQLKTELARIASDSVGEAWNDTYNASKRLKEIEDRLREAAENAANALDFFRNLSSGGSLTYQEIINTFNQITEFNNWYNDYGSGITRMYSGYTQFKAGLVGEFADGLEGAWGVIGTHLNSLSGTVGTVESRINAAEATISDVATWYNLSADTISEVKRTIDAKIGLIEDAVNYIYNDLENSIVSTINGMAGTITTDISTRYTGAINNIQQELNGLSASVSTKITHYDTLEGRLARVEDEMNASAHGDQANYTKAVTIAESAWTHADQMRETWSQASGMLRTVSELSIKEDQYGPIYWYIPNVEEPETKYRVKYLGKLNNELIFWQPSSWPTSDKPSLDGVISLTDGQEFNGGYIRKNDVYPDYVTNAFSFIQQAASHISMAVSRDDIKAAIELSVEDDESKIYLGANSILLDGKVIADSLTAKAANIGGVHIGYGMISAQTGDKKWALRSDGVLEAASANVRGVITADQLILGDGMTGGQGPQGIEDYVNSFVVQAGGMTETEVRNIVSGMAQAGQWGVVDPGGDYYIVGTTISGTSADSAFTVSKSGCLIAKNGIFSGTVFATNGVFNGTVYAKNGEFAGSVSANSGYFKNMQADNLTIDNSSFSGDVYARNGYFSGEINASKISSSKLNGSKIYGSEIYGSSLSIDDDYSNSCYVSLGDPGQGVECWLSRALDKSVDIFFQMDEDYIIDSNTVSNVMGASIPAGNRLGYCFIATYNSNTQQYDILDSQGYEIIVDDARDHRIGLTDAWVGDKNEKYGRSIIFNRDRTYVKDFIEVNQILDGLVLYKNKQETGFYVSSKGKLEAYDANINGSITMNDGNRIVMKDDDERERFVLSSTAVQLENAYNNYIIQKKTFTVSCSSIWDGKGYGGENGDKSTGNGVLLCSFYKSQGDTFTNRPTITLKVSSTGNRYTSSFIADAEVFVKINGSRKAGLSQRIQAGGHDDTPTQKQLSLEDGLSDSDYGLFEIYLTYQIDCWTSAPESQNETYSVSCSVSVLANGNIILGSSNSNTQNCFKIGSNGIQMILTDGSKMTFGLFQDGPIFSVELKSGGNTSAALKIDNIGGITYLPLGGSSYKTLT